MLRIIVAAGHVEDAQRLQWEVQQAQLRVQQAVQGCLVLLLVNELGQMLQQAVEDAQWLQGVGRAAGLAA
jgi:hypothetical protein